MIESGSQPAGVAVLPVRRERHQISADAQRALFDDALRPPPRRFCGLSAGPVRLSGVRFVFALARESPPGAALAVGRDLGRNLEPDLLFGLPRPAVPFFAPIRAPAEEAFEPPSLRRDFIVNRIGRPVSGSCSRIWFSR